jgi:integrase
MARRRLPVYLRERELERLLAAVPTERDRLIVLIGAYAGLRVSEICKLRVEHLDFEDGMLEVHAGKGDKDRTVPMHPQLARALRVWIGSSREGWLFPSERGQSGHLTTRAVQLMIRAAAERAEIVRHVTPHKLRHSFATNLLAKGADLLEIKDLLGHSSVATTQIYAQALPERLRSAVERL